MPVQLTYSRTGKKGLPGLVAWDFGPADITTVIAEGVIPFGNGVVKGTGSRSGIVGNAAGTVLGLAVRSILSVNAINTNADAFGATEVVAIMREGYMWVLNEGTAALAEGSTVYLDAAGKVVNSAAAGAVALTGSRVEQPAAVGEVALIRIQTSIPAPAAP